MVRFDNVTKMFPRQHRPALADVSVGVGKGEFVFLVGPSGAGKSTLVRLVLRQERPSRAISMSRVRTWRG